MILPVAIGIVFLLFMLWVASDIAESKQSKISRDVFWWYAHEADRHFASFVAAKAKNDVEAMQEIYKQLGECRQRMAREFKIMHPDEK